MSAQRKRIIACNPEHLRKLVYNSIQKYGPNCDLNFIEVSGVFDMDFLFAGPNSVFNGDISQWDVSLVGTMREMFHGSQFNGDISGWDVSGVYDMDGMFQNSVFNGDISNWDVSHVETMNNMFESSQFNGDISNWDVSRVDSMFCMFQNSVFNGDISRWDVSSAVDMCYLFAHSQFNGDISQWDVSNVEYMRSIFAYSRFMGDISGWNISDDSDCCDMFEGSLWEMKGELPEWYKVNMEKLRQKYKSLADNCVSEEDFNQFDDDEMDNLPF